MRFSWIVTITWLYVAGVLLYSLQDESLFWDHFFWIDNSLTCIAGFTFNFIRFKSIKERAHIAFLVALKIFNLTYYIVGLILDEERWMNTNVFFLVVVAISAFISFLKYRSWKRN